MRKRTRVALLLAAGVLVTLGLFITFPGFEPTYEGKPLAYWIEPFQGESTPEQAHANIAIHALCAGRIPALLADMEYDPLPQEAKWRNIMQRLPRFLRTGRLASLALADRRADRAYVAQFALRAMGQDDPRVSIGLSRLMQSTNYVVSFRACWTMSYLGTNGLAWLVRVASQTTNTVARTQALDHMRHLYYLGTNATPAVAILAASARETNFAISWFAITALGQLRLQPEISTAALQAALGNPDFRCRRAALTALRAFGSAAIPALSNALADPDPRTRREAASVLEQIAPTTFTNAAVKQETVAGLALITARSYWRSSPTLELARGQSITSGKRECANERDGVVREIATSPTPSSDVNGVSQRDCHVSCEGSWEAP